MAKIVECIPNFSEGRNQAVIDGLALFIGERGGNTKTPPPQLLL